MTFVLGALLICMTVANIFLMREVVRLGKKLNDISKAVCDYDGPEMREKVYDILTPRTR